MRDLVFILITVGFFALAAAFVAACARIVGPDDTARPVADRDAESVPA